MKKSLLLLLLQCALVLCGREIPFLATAPVIDGSPGDAVWKKAAYIPRFNSYGEEKSPSTSNTAIRCSSERTPMFLYATRPYTYIRNWTFPQCRRQRKT